MSSTEAARAATEGIHRVWPSAQVLQIPVSDGGEGLLDSILTAKGGTIIHLLAHDPLMRLVPTRYGVLNDRQTAVIEMAEINGLNMLKADERNPMRTSSYGTGELISRCFEKRLQAHYHRFGRQRHLRWRTWHATGTRNSVLRLPGSSDRTRRTGHGYCSHHPV